MPRHLILDDGGIIPSPESVAPYSGGALCPTLYRRLQEVFGPVEISCAGQPFRGFTVARGAGARNRTMVSDAGEYYITNCPYCRDTKRHLWINHTYGQFESDGRRRDWVAICYKGCLDTADNRRDLADRILGFQNANLRGRALRIEDTVLEETHAVAAPPGWITPVTELLPAHPAVQYLVGRDYSPRTADAFEIGFVSNAVAKYRETESQLYFPIKMHGALVGWQCRPPVDRWQEAGYRSKYFSMPGMKKRLCLYNYDQAKHAPLVVVVEGPTSAHRVGWPAVATLGKSVSAAQESLLLLTWANKPIVILYDGDAAEVTSAVTARLRDARGGTGGSVLPVYLPPGTDPGVISHVELWARITAEAAARNIKLGF